MPRVGNRFQLSLRGKTKSFVLFLQERETRLRKAALAFRRFSKPCLAPESIPALALLPKPSYKGVGFSGSRHKLPAKQVAGVRKQLELLLARNNNLFRHGDCLGADEIAHKKAKSLHAYLVIYPPKNKNMRAFCGGANHMCAPDEYLARNHKIVEHSAVLLAAPSTFEEEQRSGTWATIRYARKLGRHVFIVFPDGSASAEIPNLTS